MKKLKFFIATFAVVACATILSVRAISYSHAAMFANLEALSKDEANVELESQTAYEYDEFSLNVGKWRGPNRGFCVIGYISKNAVGTCWELVESDK